MTTELEDWCNGPLLRSISWSLVAAHPTMLGGGVDEDLTCVVKVGGSIEKAPTSNVGAPTTLLTTAAVVAAAAAAAAKLFCSRRFDLCLDCFLILLFICDMWVLCNDVKLIELFFHSE